MLLNILNILSIMLVIYGVYYVLTSITAFSNFNKQLIGKYAPKSKFKVLVACRNEEAVIASLIESINAQNYPKDMYELCVIPNNCTDDTRQITLNLGARVIDCTGECKCKGDALRYAFNTLSDEEFDAYVIFDADNVVHPNFLTRMNDALQEGYMVVQGYRDSKNPSDNWISGSYSIYYWMQNFFFNRSRMNVRASASINGTGFMVKKEVIDKYGFDTVTLTEDIEFTAQCAINNIRIAFVEDAITYDEQPVSWSASWKQRKRWSTGAHNCLKIYGVKLIQAFVKNKNMLSLDMALNFMSPLVQVIGTMIMVVMLILKLYMKIELGTLTLLGLVQITGIHICVITYITNILINIFVVKYNKRKILRMLSGILLYSFFILTWIPINFISIVSKEKKWEQIIHTRSIGIEDIINE
ncbi:MAG: glycosyltransferase family 2 protein [Clostridia bacterium]|nr:glycosyltransferase family 2 protein [Clostridia bacterium]